MTETGEPEAIQIVPDVIQVLLPPAIQAAFRGWLAARGLMMFPIPVEDDLSTYGIAPRSA